MSAKQKKTFPIELLRMSNDPCYTIRAFQKPYPCMPLKEGFTISGTEKSLKWKGLIQRLLKQKSKITKNKLLLKVRNSFLIKAPFQAPFFSAVDQKSFHLTLANIFDSRVNNKPANNI